MSVCIVFPCVIMAILADRLMRSQFLEPFFIILVQPMLIIVDEDRGGDMHGVNQNHTLANTTFP